MNVCRPDLPEAVSTGARGRWGPSPGSSRTRVQGTSAFPATSAYRTEPEQGEDEQDGVGTLGCGMVNSLGAHVRRRVGGGIRVVAHRVVARRVVRPSAEDPDDPFAEDVRRPVAFDSVPVYISDSHGKTAPVASLDAAHSRSCCASSSAYGS